MKSIRTQLHRWLQENSELVQYESPSTVLRWFVRESNLDAKYTYPLLKPVLDKLVTYTAEGSVRNVNR